MTSDKQPAQEQDRQPGLESEMTTAPDYAPRFAASGRLKGKTVLITGGDSGIGRASAVLCAREGANVAIHYKDEHADAEATVALIREEGAEGFSVSGDIGQKDEVDRAVRAVIEKFGRINVLVNNAAEQHVQDKVEDIPEAQLKRTFQTNIFGQFYMVQAVVPQMEKSDAIVNITSVTAFRGQPQLIDYASTKGAILAFTRALSGNLASTGIRVNAVAPGPIWTPLIPASFPAEKVETFGQNVPMGRPGQPNEVASCVLFLACDDSSYLTGQTLHPNGGELVGG
ncbi:glucose 1-dehydrogenase [Pseudotabrizicola formosa]|uniref:glucose 1-dehydrogenase n=1 Tax=Pseudotabrizicola formosa TaxID=2030009 RepID=UPI000CD253B6|nr:glucose 1-dehydrogenase [Pseudotabrizicola formosa]